MLIIFFICPFSFFLIKITYFSLVIRARIFKFCISSDNGVVCRVIGNQDAEIYFFCLSLPCNTKGNLHLQNWFNIPLIAMAIGM